MAQRKNEFVGWRRTIRITPETWEFIKGYAEDNELTDESPERVLADILGLSQGVKVIANLTPGEQVNYSNLFDDSVTGEE